MFIKSTLLAAIVAALALAVAPIASAAELTDSEGNPIPVGAQLEGTSTDTVLITEALGTVECEEVSLFNELTENSGSIIEAEATSEGAAANCFNEGNPIEVTDVTMIRWQTFPAINAGVALITEKIDLPGGIVCHFEGEVNFTFVTNSDTMTIVGGILRGGICGEAELNGNYKWTWKGNPVIFK